MKKQFFVSYAIAGRDAFDQYSNGVEVEFKDDDSVLDKKDRIAIQIAKAHNQVNKFVNKTGQVYPNEIYVNVLTRLD